MKEISLSLLLELLREVSYTSSQIDQTQMTCCLVCGQETGKYDPFALFLLSYFGLHSRADQNYTGRGTLHFARLKNLQQQYDITADVRYDRLTISPNLMVTQGRPWTKGRQCIRLCLMHALSGSIGRACLYRREKAVANMSRISTGGIFLAKADHPAHVASV